MSNFKIQFVDRYREPQCAPDPNYPTGKDVDCSVSPSPICKTDLPYPAKRCGVYIVKCLSCGQNIAITTAGRPDDPRSLTLSCKSKTVQ